VALTREKLCDPIDPGKLKADFPLLQQLVGGRPIVYLDSAASSQKPQSVLDAMDDEKRNKKNEKEGRRKRNEKK